MSSRALAPLRVRSFKPLAASYTINETGDWLGLVALSVLVFNETDSALALTGLFLAANLVPALLAPLLTARIDRVAVHRALPAIYLVEGAIFIALALLADSFSLAAVLVLALADGVLLLTARALSRAAVATALEPHGMLREGNAIVNVGFAGATAVGPALGGIVVAGLGVREALLLDAASFAFIAALLTLARGIPSARPDPEPLLERVRAGVGYVWRDAYLRTLVAGQAAAFVFFATVLPIEVVYAKESLGTDERGFGLLLAAWGSGIFVGSLVFAGLRGRQLGVIAASTALVGLAYLGMAAAGTLLVACALAVVGGAGNGVQWVALVTAVQEATDADLQARVVGLVESAGAAMPGLGFLLGGAVAALAGPRAAFVVAGAGVLAVLAVAALAMRAAPRPDRAPAAV
ncbi:MAG TPA: MFS transporter [Solirubrobacteraceae bacterium]|nr:MFS transporter [Solirubrobacteraceae bacterium]